MKYSIAFKGLPFEPDERQVIYVENDFDERINAIIKGNYERLKWIFNRANLDFVYLPMFFNDEETREKVLYYAPYLTNEVIEKAELRSSYLLGYMSHLENNEKISPSLLYAPKKEDDEWTFEGQKIDCDITDSDFLKYFEDLVVDIEEELSLVTLFRSRRYDEDIDEIISANNTETTPLEPSKPEYSSSGLSRFSRWLKGASCKCLEEEYDEESESSTNLSLDDILEEGAEEAFEDLERNIKRLRLYGIPLVTIVEFVAKYETISRLRITDDLRIILPEYNNKEVKMSALYKALYLLFVINRKKGIVLQRLEEHHSDLVYLYKKTLKRDNLTPRQFESINKLETSYNDEGSIYVTLTRIKTAFKSVIDEHLAKYYYIVGRPGEPYNITLSEDLIEWEDEK